MEVFCISHRNMAAFSLPFVILTLIIMPTRSESVATTPPRGWNSYDAFSWGVTEDEFLANANIVANILKSAGYEYVVVDFLWYRKHVSGASVRSPGFDIIDEWGRPVPDSVRWPSTAGGKGFAPIADIVHAMGLKLGIHVMRGISTAAVAQNTPILGAEGWRARDIALTNRPCGWMSQCFLSVNTSSEGGRAFIRSLYQQYASWGVDFIKHDCVFGVPDFSLDEITTVSEAIIETGRPIVYSLSPGDQANPDIGTKVSKLSHMYRVTGDDWDRWSDVSNHFDVASTFASAGLIGAPGLQGGRSWPDLDMLPFGWLTDPGSFQGPHRYSQLTLDEQKTQLTLWAMARSPLIYGGDLRRIDHETIQMISNPILLNINSHSSGNTEYYSGFAPGNEGLPIFSVVDCHKATNTHWRFKFDNPMDIQREICWSARKKSQTLEASGCLNWTLPNYGSTSLRREASEKQKDATFGNLNMWTSLYGSICFNSQLKFVLSPDLVASKQFTPCGMGEDKAWQLTADGRLHDQSSGLCAEINVRQTTRIWLARGLAGEYFVAFFNLGEKSITISLALSEVIKGPFTQCSGVEVWTNQELTAQTTLSASVPKHGSALFSFLCT